MNTHIELKSFLPDAFSVIANTLKAKRAASKATLLLRLQPEWKVAKSELLPLITVVNSGWR